MKRALDFTAALIGLVILSPLLALVCVLVRITSKGPVFFLQERVGRSFQRFRIIKFRTMVPNAASLGRAVTAGNDPRITRLGKLLRQTKIDELPQLLNVLMGQMSLVGPRPEVPKYVEMFRQDYEEVLSIRPGITDPASIKFRNEQELLGKSKDPERTYVTEILPEKLRLAKEYIHGANLYMDLAIILRTIFARGAKSGG